MAGMSRLIALLPIAALILAAACTDKKSKVLDESCMKDRGWVALGGDIGPPIKAPDPTTSKGATKGKY